MFTLSLSVEDKDGLTLNHNFKYLLFEALEKDLTEIINYRLSHSKIKRVNIEINYYD